jgi:diaminopimelate epimerase
MTGRPFYKMSGSGNDFVVFDARHEPAGELESAAVIRRLCSRGSGVGADGVVFIEAADRPAAHVRMRYFNSDGSRAAACGNATLCVTRLAAELEAAPQNGMLIETDSGVLQASVVDGLPEAELAPVRTIRPDAGITPCPGESRIGFALVGVPHLTILCEDVEQADIVGRGAPLRRHPSLGADGANVNFVSPGSTPGRWTIRTYERGVEGETLACGTGSIATTVLLHEWGVSGTEATLETRSGRTLVVRLAADAQGWRPRLRGEARLVYRGTLGEV